MNEQPDFEPYSDHRRPPSMSPIRRRARILRSVSIVLLIVGFLLVMTNPESEGLGKTVGLAGVALYLYAWILRFKTRGE